MGRGLVALDYRHSAADHFADLAVWRPGLIPPRSQEISNGSGGKSAAFRMLLALFSQLRGLRRRWRKSGRNSRARTRQGSGMDFSSRASTHRWRPFCSMRKRSRPNNCQRRIKIMQMRIASRSRTSENTNAMTNPAAPSSRVTATLPASAGVVIRASSTRTFIANTSDVLQSMQIVCREPRADCMGTCNRGKGSARRSARGDAIRPNCPICRGAFQLCRPKTLAPESPVQAT
jgi:hypothetical protein